MRGETRNELEATSQVEPILRRAGNHVATAALDNDRSAIKNTGPGTIYYLPFVPLRNLELKFARLRRNPAVTPQRALLIAGRIPGASALARSLHNIFPPRWAE